jgi:hypothetical protein
MRVGGTHHWYYEKGEWKEKSVAPDKWEFMQLIREEHGMLQRAQGFRLEQSIIGIFSLIRMLEN